MLQRLRIALCAVWCLLSGCGWNAGHYVKKGDELYRAKHYEDASLNYRKALQKSPNFGDAYLGFGRSELKLQRLGPAWRALHRAVELLPNNRGAKIDLGEACLAGLIVDQRRPKNLYDQLGAIADQLLAADSNSLPGLRFKGYLALIDGRMEDSVRYFTRAVEIAPREPDIVISLVESLFQNQQEQEAERVARRFIESNKSNGTAYDALYVHYLHKNLIADAAQILELKVANNPDQPSYVTQLSQFYWGHGKQAQALDAITKMTARARPADYLAAGDFYSSISHWDDADQEFREGMRAAPREALLFKKKIANLLLAQGKKTEAASQVAEILEQQPHDEEALRIDAGLKLASGQPADLDSAIKIYQGLLETNSHDSQLHYDLGRAYQMQRRFPSANIEFREAGALNPSFLAPRLGLAEIALSQGKPEEAVRVTDEIILMDAANIRARLLRSMALRNLNRLDAAATELEEVVKRSPQEKSAYLQLGLLEVERKDLKKAEADFSKLRSLGGDASSAALGFAMLYSSQGQADRAYDLLKKDLAQYPDHAVVHELLAAAAIEAHQYDHAVGEYNALLVTNPGSAAVYLKLAEAFRLKGDRNNYISTLQRAQKAAPQELMPTVLLAAALGSAGQRDASISEYRRALEIQPDDPRVLNNLAYAMVQANVNLDEALRLAQRAVQKSPDQPIFADTLGWIYLKQKMPDSALRVFSGLVKKYPEDPKYRYHFAATLLEKGDKQAARNELQAALKKKPSHEDEERIRELLARLG
jgi:tetratricopeptide (TPR) repeat protein